MNNKKRGSSLLLVSLILLVGVLVYGTAMAETQADIKNWLYGEDVEKLESPQLNPLGLDIDAMTRAAGLPLVGVYVPENHSDLTVIYAEGDQYLVVYFTSGRIIFDEEEDTLTEIAGTPAEIIGGKDDHRLHLNSSGLMVEVETNRSVDELRQFAEDLVNVIEPQHGVGYLINHFPGMDGEISSSKTGTSLSLEELRKQAPFQVVVPELANWHLSEDDHFLTTRQSYQYSHFYELTFSYSHDRRKDLALSLVLGAEEGPLYSGAELIDTFTDQGVEFRHYSYPVRNGDTGDLMKYENIHWQAGDLHLQLSINKSDQDLPTLAKECADQLGAISVDEEKAKTPRASYKLFSIRGTIEEYAPYFTERAIDFPQIGNYRRGTYVTFEEDGDESLTFNYDDGENRFTLTQHQRHNYYGEKSYTVDGVKVHVYSYEASIIREDGRKDITVFVMKWFVGGYHFELHGQDEPAMQEFIEEVNALVRDM